MLALRSSGRAGEDGPAKNTSPLLCRLPLSAVVFSLSSWPDIWAITAYMETAEWQEGGDPLRSQRCFLFHAEIKHEGKKSKELDK